MEKNYINVYIQSLNKSLSNDLLTNTKIDINKYNSSNSKTGYKGVYKHKDGYRVQLVNNYNKYSLGVYSDLNLAVKKYAMVNLLLNNTKQGGVSFNTGSDNIKCKKKKDCENTFNDLKKNEKVKCNIKTGICERYMNVSKYINNTSKIDCRKKENKELVECKKNKKDCRKKENKKLAECKKKRL